MEYLLIEMRFGSSNFLKKCQVSHVSFKGLLFTTTIFVTYFVNLRKATLGEKLSPRYISGGILGDEGSTAEILKTKKNKMS